jgi:uncharacterized membrane protein
MIGLKSSGIGAGLIAAMAAAGAWALLHVGVGAEVPIHFDLSGTPNNFAPAWFGLFILPALGALLWLLPAILPRIDPRGENVRRSVRALGKILLASTIVIALAQAMIVCATMGVRIDTTHLVGVMLGGMFMAIGNVFGKLRWNYTVGIRTPWTLANERVGSDPPLRRLGFRARRHADGGAIVPTAAWLDDAGAHRIDRAYRGAAYLEILHTLAGRAESARLKRSFLKKKNQKNFATAGDTWRVLRHAGAAPAVKVFASFFKKKRLLGHYPGSRILAIIPVVLCPGTSSASTTRPPAARTTSAPTILSTE